MDPGVDPGLDARPDGGIDRGSSRAARGDRDLARSGNQTMALVVGATLAVAALVVFVGGRGGEKIASSDAASAAATPGADEVVAQAAAGSGAAAAAVDDAAQAQTAAEAEPEPRSVDLEGCQIDKASLMLGDSGEAVVCIQKALYAAGYYDGEFTGQFDGPTDLAAKELQGARDLYVDGIIGRQTASELGIWPGEEAFIVRTPVPPAGATDLWGMPLSSVSSVGDDAPPMPADTGQGTGKRIVYSRAGQRIWAVDDQERVVRSYLVTGSQYANEVPGVHQVYSRSEESTAWNGEARLPLMVRWLDTERGAIGFHGIPIHIDDGTPYQTEAELGQRLSGGCQRQANPDAAFMWQFGTIGTRVIVV